MARKIKTDTPPTHWVAGSGFHGCLYDYSAAYRSESDAIDGLCVVHYRTRNMRRSLRVDGYFEFPKGRGADYAEIVECNCARPWEHAGYYADASQIKEWKDWQREQGYEPE